MIEGIVRDVREIPDKYNPGRKKPVCMVDKYDIDCSGTLSGLPSIEGATVRIIYTGKETSNSGNEYRTFKVMVRN